MEKRYQVFISSTYEDLKEERKEIIEQLLNAKYIPAGMEMFAASNEEQFKYIKKIIDNCDYYVLILGARYGSVNAKSEKSFTEMEYDYAIEKGIPVLAFVHRDPENIIADKREKDNPKLFSQFRDKVLKNSKMSKMWSNKGELISNVIISLVQIADEFPRNGWVRDEQNTTELLAQINQLRLENEALKNENIELIQDKKSSMVEGELARGEDEFEIVGQSYDLERQWEDEFDYYDVRVNFQDVRGKGTWNGVFKAVAPKIFSTLRESEFREGVDEYCAKMLNLERFAANEDTYNQIKFQMIALEWISIIEEGGFGDNFICLTEEGKKEFMNIITFKRSNKMKTTMKNIDNK